MSANHLTALTTLSVDSSFLDAPTLRARLIERGQFFQAAHQTLPSSPPTFDAVIVGARIAGCTLAYPLARRGWRIALVESADLPLGDTLSLPSVHARALHLMDALDLGPVLERVAPYLRQIRTVRLPMDARIGTISGYFPPAYHHEYSIIAIRRIFDPILFQYVLLDHDYLPQECPITFVPAAAIGVICDDRTGAIGGVECQWAKQETTLYQTNGSSGSPVNGSGAPSFQLNAPLVIGADGRLSRVARFVTSRLAQQRAQLTPSLAAYMRKRQKGGARARSAHNGVDRLNPSSHPTAASRVTDPALEYDIKTSDTTLFYAPIRNMQTEGMADVEFVPGPDQCMLLCGEAGKTRGDYQIAGAFIPVHLFDTFRKGREKAIRACLEGSSLGPRVHEMTFTGPVMGLSPQVANGFFRPAGGAGWALVGDAAHFKDPSSGHGFHDALFTVQSLLAGLDSIAAGAPLTAEQARTVWPHVALRVTRERDQELHAMYEFTYQFGKGLTTPPGFIERALLRHVATHPEATQRFLGVLSGATPIAQFQRASLGYLALGLLSTPFSPSSNRGASPPTISPLAE